MTEQCQLRKHSSYRGVCWHASSRKWRAYCGSTHLGLYADETTAAVVALQERQRRHRTGWENPEIEELADLLGPIPTTRRWTWRKGQN